MEAEAVSATAWRTEVVQWYLDVHYNGAKPGLRPVESLLKTGAYGLPHFGTLHAITVPTRRPRRLLSFTA
jgi:hypothetical protein